MEAHHLVAVAGDSSQDFLVLPCTAAVLRNGGRLVALFALETFSSASDNLIVANPYLVRCILVLTIIRVGETGGE